MSPEADYMLAQAMLATTVAVVFIALMRKPFRYAFGARVAYWIWLLVPASALVVLLPIAAKPIYAPKSFLSPPLRSVVSGALQAVNQANTSMDAATIVLALWAGGVLVAIAVILSRYLAFVRSLGVMTLQPDGSLSATGCVDPVLLGVVHPRVVLPADFESRYDDTERAMVLTHERAHLSRWTRKSTPSPQSGCAFRGSTRSCIGRQACFVSIRNWPATLPCSRIQAPRRDAMPTHYSRPNSLPAL